MRCYSLKNGRSVVEKTITPFNEFVDVVVVGLGTAGSMAAIVAAEEGLSVLGVERTTGMGGTGTLGCVWDYFYGSPGGRSKGINRECEQMLQQGYVASDITHENKSLPGSVKCQVLEQTAIQSGCRILYETIVTGLFVDNGKVTGVRCLRDGHTQCFGTSMVIDATGEATLCRMVGCRIQAGRKSDGKQQQFSKTIGLLQDNYVRGAWTICGTVDITNATSLSQKIIESSAMPPYLKEYYTQDERMIFEGTILGVRETCYIDSEENLSFYNLMNKQRTQKPVFYAFAPLDNMNRDIAYESIVHQDWHLIAEMGSYGFSAGIPMGALIPKGLDGILVAGKGMGLDHDLTTAVRMKKDLENSGEAAARLAYLAIRDSKPTYKVSYNDLADALRQSGCLDSEDDVTFGSLAIKDGERWQRVNMLDKPEDIRDGMSSQSSSIAIWSVRQCGTEMLKYLIEWSKSPHKRLARNSVIALGLLGDSRACPLLRTIAFEVQDFTKARKPRYFYPDACKAICLLGRLCDSNAAEGLLSIVENCASLWGSTYEQHSFYTTYNDYVFQFISLSIASLVQIAQAHPVMREMITTRLRKWVLDPNLSLVISMGRVEMIHPLREFILNSLPVDYCT